MLTQVVLWASAALALGQKPLLSWGNGTYQIAGQKLSPQIIVDAEDFPSVTFWADRIATDFGKLTGINATVLVLQRDGSLVKFGGFDWFTFSPLWFHQQLPMDNFADVVDFLSKNTGNGTFSLTLTPAAIDAKQPVIVAATFNKSRLATPATSAGKTALNVTGFDNEDDDMAQAFTSAVVQTPFAASPFSSLTTIPAAHVLIGADKLGTIYAMTRVVEELGISPLWWWTLNEPTPLIADQKAFAPESYVQGPPTVKYRGLFINEEQNLIPWSNTTFPGKKLVDGTTSTSVLNAESYGPLWDLIVRSRGNLYWPGSWVAACPFSDNRCLPMATLFGVFTGSSHTEPLSTYQGEALSAGITDETYNLDGGREAVLALWRSSLKRAKPFDVVLTLDFRGLNDYASLSATAQNLNTVLRLQQQLIVEIYGEEAAKKVPRSFIPYNEVLQFFDQGLQIDDDIPVTWVDENWAQIRRLPSPSDDKIYVANPNSSTSASKTGKRLHSLYYHGDNHGGPADYRMIDTVSLAHTWLQVSTAIDRGINNYGVMNVGKFKTDEVFFSHWLDLLYDHKSETIDYTRPDSITSWAIALAKREFCSPSEHDSAACKSLARKIGRLFLEYSLLSSRTKIDLLAQGQTDAQWFDEAYLNSARWQALNDSVSAVRNKIPENKHAALWQQLGHKVDTGYTANAIFSLVDRQKVFAYSFASVTNQMADQLDFLCDHEAWIRAQMNQVAGGRFIYSTDLPTLYWDKYHWYMPSYSVCPRGYRLTLDAPWPNDDIQQTDVVAKYYREPPLSRADKPPRSPLKTPWTNFDGIKQYLWLFMRGKTDRQFLFNVSVSAIKSATYKLSWPSTPMVKMPVDIDWDSLPSGNTRVLVQFGPNRGDQMEFNLSKIAVPADFRGFVESGGFVMMEGCHATNRSAPTGYELVTVPYSGRQLCGATVLPLTTPTFRAPDAPLLQYAFFKTSAVSNATIILHVDPVLQTDPKQRLQVAAAIDSGSPQVVDVLPLAANETGATWPLKPFWVPMATQTVRYTSFVLALDATPNTAHTLKLWLLAPTILVTRVHINFTDNWSNSRYGPPESGSVGLGLEPGDGYTFDMMPPSE
ncbi:hypothetical protein PYCC9005_004027 [Savitreella phatthalungensis]